MSKRKIAYEHLIVSLVSFVVRVGGERSDDNGGWVRDEELDPPSPKDAEVIAAAKALLSTIERAAQ